MANVATARALFGLGNDLNDKELLLLTASQNRRPLKEFLATLAPLIPEPKITSYSITIHHGDSFAKRIKALACNWVHPWITEVNTPVTIDKSKGTEGKEVFVVHFNRSIGSDEAVADMLALEVSLKPAMHEDLLAFGTKHKDVQRQYPIVQLGSSWERPDDGRVVSYLDRRESGRALGLSVWHRDWPARCLFLAVRA